MIQAIHHGQLPTTLHVDQPTTPHRLDRRQRSAYSPRPNPGPRNDQPRRAAVSSFGISGTNAHVILEEPDPPRPSRRPPTRTPTRRRPPSGHRPRRPHRPCPTRCQRKPNTALREQAQRLHQHLTTHPELDPTDVAHTLATTRTTLPPPRRDHRRPPRDHGRHLSALAHGLPHPDLTTGHPIPGKTVFVFPGQGSQWPDMGQHLLTTNPTFAHHIHACTDTFNNHHLDWNLHDLLTTPQRPTSWTASTSSNPSSSPSKPP